MIKVFIPSNTDFKKYEPEIKNMYESFQTKICDSNTFDFIKNNTLFYMFVNDENLIGGIYYFLDNNKLFLNGFAGRKHHKENLECLKMSLKWFNCDIYAEAQNRASALCLIKCGFKRIHSKLFVYCHQNTV